MSFAEAIVIGSFILSIGAIIYKLVSVRKNGNGKVQVCMVHSGMEEKLNSLKEGQERIEEAIRTIFEHIRGK